MNSRLIVSSALASALGQLLDDASLRQKFGQQAQARVEQEFSLAAMAERTLMLYQRVLSGLPSSGADR